MAEIVNPGRRAWLQRIAAGFSCASVVVARPAATFEFPAPDPAAALLLSIADPAAVAVHYAEDAAKAEGAKPGSSCANCSAYTGKTGAVAGPCTLFPNKVVKAAGWCNAWSNL